MKILILEDEPLVARSLVAAVGSLEPQAVLAGPLASVREALAWFGQHFMYFYQDNQWPLGLFFRAFGLKSLSGKSSNYVNVQ